MHRYTVSFDSEALDEARLRDLLAEELGILLCAITRTPSSGTDDRSLLDAQADTQEEAPESDAALILKLADQVEMFAPRDVKEAYPELEMGNIARRCVSLAERGKIHRVAHGIYSRLPAGRFTQDQVEANRSLRKVEQPWNRADTRSDELLSYLRIGRSSSDIQSFLGVSRQRVHQKLDDMMRQGLVCRVPGPDNKYIYALDQRSASAARPQGWPKLTAASEAALSKIPNHGIIKVTALQASLDIRSSGLHKMIQGLVDKGLVETRKIGLNKCIMLTDLGRRHPVRSGEGTSLEASDPIQVFGEERAAVLHELLSEGELTTSEISARVPGVQYAGIGISGLIAEMKRADLIAKAPGEARKSRYRLTPDGRRLILMLKKLSQPDSTAKPASEKADADGEKGTA